MLLRFVKTTFFLILLSFAQNKPNLLNTVDEIINIQNELDPVQDGVSVEIKSFKEKYQTLFADDARFTRENASLEIEVATKNNQRIKITNKIRDEERVIKRLHDEIESIKTNISSLKNQISAQEKILPLLVQQKVELQQKESGLQREVYNLQPITQRALRPI